MALSQWSLLDTCMCSLFGTGDYCGLDCCTNAHSIGRTGKTLNEGKFLFFQHGKSCLMLGSFSNRKRQPDSWWLVAIEFLEACHTAASGTKQFSHHKVWGVFEAQLSTLRRRHSSLIWPFAKMKTLERMALSQWSLLDTCMSSLCLFFQHGESCSTLGWF